MLFPSISSTLTYYYCSSYYIIAYLLSVLACYFIIKHDDTKYIFLSIGLLIFSIHIYQAYIGVAATIFLLYLLQCLLKKEMSIKEILKKLYKFLFIGITSGILYLITLYLLIELLEFGLTTDRNFNTMGQINITKLPFLIRDTYYNFYQYFFGNEIINNAWANKYIFNICIFLFGIIVITLRIIKNKLYKSYSRLILIIICIMAIPIVLDLITILAPSVSIYETTGIIMLPTMNLLYIFIISISEYDRKLFSKSYKVGKYVFIGNAFYIFDCIHISFYELP